MKKIIPALAAAVFLVFSSVALAGTIAGTAHDFRGYPWNTTGEICLSCHTPHPAKFLPSPLWDYESPLPPYALYGSAPFVAKEGITGIRPDGYSKICLSCHDGTVATENFGEITDQAIRLHKDALIGEDLRSDHPVSFLYDTSLCITDGDLYDPLTRLSGVAGGKGTIHDDMLFEGRMECPSCHDVHNKRAVPGTRLLLKDTAGSALCLTCHDK